MGICNGNHLTLWRWYQKLRNLNSLHQLTALKWLNVQQNSNFIPFSTAKCFMCFFLYFALTDANISWGIWDGKLSTDTPHRFFVNSDAIDVAQLAFIWLTSACDDELRLKFSGEFIHDDGVVRPANPTNDIFCCCNDAKFCKFWKFSIFCTEMHANSLNRERKKRKQIDQLRCRIGCDNKMY